MKTYVVLYWSRTKIQFVIVVLPLLQSENGAVDVTGIWRRAKIHQKQVRSASIRPSKRRVWLRKTSSALLVASTTTMANVDAIMRPSASIDVLRLEAAQKVRLRQQLPRRNGESHSFLQALWCQPASLPIILPSWDVRVLGAVTGCYRALLQDVFVDEMLFIDYQRLQRKCCAVKSRLELRECNGEVVVVTAGASLAACSHDELPWSSQHLCLERREVDFQGRTFRRQLRSVHFSHTRTQTRFRTLSDYSSRTHSLERLLHKLFVR